MSVWPSLRRKRLAGPWLALLLCLAVVGCEAPDENYLQIAGGGFIFNYRIGEATSGLVAEAARPLPEDALLVATFEDPAGGEPIRIESAPRPGQLRFVFDTPPLQGIEAERPYLVTLELVSKGDGTVLERHEKQFRSNVGQDVLPDAPLTVGPGYARNPALPAN